MGLLGAAFGLGFMLGPTIGGYLSTFGFAVPAYFAAGIAGLTTLATTLFLKETINTKVAQNSPKTAMTFQELKFVLSTPPISTLVLTFFLLSLAFSGMQGTYALFVQAKFGWGPKEVGNIFGLIGITAIITQVKILPWFLLKFGERKTLASSVPILALGFGLISVIKNIPLMMAANTLIPLGNSLANPTLTAIATESIPKEDYGETLGILQSAGSLGHIFGPVVATEIFTYLGHNAPFQVSSLIFIIVSLFILPKITRPKS